MRIQPGLVERVMGIEPTPSAWKAEVLPLNYTRLATPNSGFQHSGLTRSKPTAFHSADLVEGEGFEPSKAEPTDLQSVPFDRSGTPPTGKDGIVSESLLNVNLMKAEFCH